jgi:hypothetical protein
MEVPPPHPLVGRAALAIPRKSGLMPLSFREVPNIAFRVCG